jgi:hypothetical protein
LTWTATDLAQTTASENTIRIRKGDSLLLTANGTGTALEIDADGDGAFEKSGVPGQNFPHQYTSAGTFVAKAKIDGIEAGSLTIIVIGVDLKGITGCQVNYLRAKEVLVSPATEVASVAFLPLDLALLDVSLKTTTATGATLNVRAAAKGESTMSARLGQGGPLLATEKVLGFEMVSLNRTSTGFVIGDDGYGTGVLRFQITPRTVIDNDNPATPEIEGLYFDLSLGGTGFFFADNGTSKIRVHSNIQDQDGIAEVAVMLSPNGTVQCHTLKAVQINTPATTCGETPLNNPHCTITARKVLVLQREAPKCDEVDRDGRKNLYPPEHARKDKQIFQVWDHDGALDGRWTERIRVNEESGLSLPRAMEEAFFPLDTQPTPNRHFTIKCNTNYAHTHAVALTLAASNPARGGAGISDNEGEDRDEMMYQQDWANDYPSSYPSLNVAPNQFTERQIPPPPCYPWALLSSPSKNEVPGGDKYLGHMSWDQTPVPTDAGVTYIDFGFHKGNMIGNMDAWAGCSPVFSSIPHHFVEANTRPQTSGNPHTHQRRDDEHLAKWKAQQVKLPGIVRCGRLEADGFTGTEGTIDDSSRDRFPDIAGANVYEVQAQVDDPDNPGQQKTVTYIRTQHDQSTGTANPVPVHITFRAAPAEKVRVGVSIATKTNAKTHKAWVDLHNDAIFEYRGQSSDSDAAKAAAVYKVTGFNEDGSSQAELADRVVEFELEANYDWFASKVVYVYGLEATQQLDDLKLVVWGEEKMYWKADPISMQTHHYKAPKLQDAEYFPIKRWYITDEEPVNVARIRFIKFETSEEAEELFTETSKLFNDALKPDGTPAVQLLIPADEMKNPYEIELIFNGMLDPLAEDPATLVLKETKADGGIKLACIETGPDTKIFRSILQFGGGRSFEVELQNVVQFDPGVADAVQAILRYNDVGSTTEYHKPLKETGANSLVLKSDVIFCTLNLGAQPTPDIVDAVQVSIFKDGVWTESPYLVETGPGTMVFRNDAEHFAVEFIGVPSFEPTKRGFCAITLSAESLGLSAKVLDVLETAPGSLTYSTHSPSSGWATAPNTDPVPEVPSEFRFRVRYEDITETAATTTISVEVLTDSGEIEDRGEITLERASPGVYLSKPIFLVTEFDSLRADVKSTLSENLFMKGDGSILERLFGKKKKPKPGGGQTVVVQANKKVNKRLWRMDQVNVNSPPWNDMEKLAVNKGWPDADENWWADKSEILDNLSKMDGDDIWVYHGHTWWEEEKPTALAGYEGWLAFQSNIVPIRPAELTAAMNGKAPGVVILAGCTSDAFKDTFVGAGCKIFAGFDDEIDQRSDAIIAKAFLSALLEGKTIQAAENAAAAKRTALGVRASLKVTAADKSKTLYETLEIKDPNK